MDLGGEDRPCHYDFVLPSTALDSLFRDVAVVGNAAPAGVGTIGVVEVGEDGGWVGKAEFPT